MVNPLVHRALTFAIGVLAVFIGMITLLPNAMLSDRGTKKANDGATFCVFYGTVPMIIGGSMMIVTNRFRFFLIVLVGLVGEGYGLYTFESI